MTGRSASTLFLEFSCAKLCEEYWPRVRDCVESLTDEQVWWRPKEASNSIGNLLLHLNGNVRQWIVSSFNHSEDARDRSAEFSERRAIPASALLEKLGATLRDASEVLARLTEADLFATFQIQGYTVTLWRAFTMWWNISECTMGKLYLSQSSCAARTWDFTRLWMQPGDFPKFR